MASGEANKVGGDTATGTHIMVAGIVFQMFSITIFMVCAIDFIRRVMRRRLLQTVTGSVVPLFAAMILSIICIYIRSIVMFTPTQIQAWPFLLGCGAERVDHLFL